MSALEFQPWPKIARLNRDITITEKIDGTNAAVVIVPLSDLDRVGIGRAPVRLFEPEASREIARVPVEINENGDWETYSVFAQSRTRFITPGQDNYGFAGWVQRNAEALVDVLGAGTHFGEWWGSGIQRKYGLSGADKRFSLFNTARWDATEFESGGLHGDRVEGLGVVPTLYHGPFDQEQIRVELLALKSFGSQAAPGFMRPEGVVVWHEASRQSFKVTLEGDAAPKGPEAHRFDEEKIAA